jgi:mono/diheme cytochrome c family protein
MCCVKSNGRVERVEAFMTANVRWSLVLVATMGAAACGTAANSGAVAGGSAGAASNVVAITPEARQEAQQIFATRCSVCHGKQGRGDGPGGAGLVPTPRNYHDPEWQKSRTDAQIEQVIVYGGAAIGRSPAMVANPDLGGKPAVVSALREIVRGFGRQ